MDQPNITKIIEQYDNNQHALIAILQDIQEDFRYLPQNALEQISADLDVPLSQVYSLATFFKAFSLEPRGKHTVSVCLGTACHVSGGQQLIEKMERDLDIKVRGTTRDLNFSLEEVHCLGCCGLAPVVTVGEDLYGQVNLRSLPKIIKKYI
jgi:NADH-quinone oxidoreductase subunit E